MSPILGITASSFSQSAPATGMYLWYDASDATTITASSGDVSQWNDKSGNAFHMTPATSLKPKTGVNTRNGKNVITFTQVSSGGYGGFRNGSTSYTTDPDLDVWIVKKHITDTIGISGAAFGIGNDQAGTAKVHYSFLDRSTNKLLSGASNSQIFSTATQLNNWVLTRFTKSGASAEFFVNNTSQGTASGNYDLGASATTVGSIPQSSGGVYVMEGDVAEVIVYKSQLSAANVTKTYNYLKAKWGF